MTAHYHNAVSPHRYKVRVYYEDTDAGGVVYHASYLRFAERARTEALRDAGSDHALLQSEHGLSFVVRRLEIRYLRPAKLDDALIVLTDTLTLGAANVQLRQVVRREDERQNLAIMRVELACIRQDTGKPARIPMRWRVALGQMATNTPGSAHSGA
jgi:acyl-CoA thioester hydrolase